MRFMLKLVVAAALLGAVTGCNSTFLGRNKGLNQVEASPEVRQNQSAKGKQKLAAKQGTTQAKKTNQTTTNSSDATIDPEAPGNNQSVPALW